MRFNKKKILIYANKYHGVMNKKEWKKRKSFNTKEFNLSAKKEDW